MKLSELEALVKAIREQGNAMGNHDPTVELYTPDLDWNLTIDVTPATLVNYTARFEGDSAARGDVALYLKKID